jgi:hypothetical protein
METKKFKETNFTKEVVNVGGTTIGVRFNVPDCELYGIEEGDKIDLSDAIIIKKEEERNDKKGKKD